MSRNPNVRLPDGTSWPWPEPDEDDLDGLEYKLRYRSPTVNERMEAASVVSAYVQLVRATRERREFVVREIRKALRQRNKHPTASPA